MKVRIEVTKKNVEFFLDGKSETIKSLIQNLVPDAEVHWDDNYGVDYIYLIIGPHRSKDYDISKFFDASMDASGIKKLFLRYLEEIRNWHENIPISSAEFEATLIQ